MKPGKANYPRGPRCPVRVRISNAFAVNYLGHQQPGPACIFAVVPEADRVSKMKFPPLPPPRNVSSLVLGLLLVACSKPQVSYYEVPHEDPARSDLVTRTAANTAATPRPAGAQLEWDKPSTWTEKPGSEMRLASYAFAGPEGAEADISVTSFPDAAGGLVANLNRWRGQVGLPPVAEGDLDRAAERIEVASLPAWLIDAVGTSNGTPTRLIGAIVPVGGTSWFFKMIGPDAVVASQRDMFRTWLETVRAVTPMTAPATAALPNAPAMTDAVPAPPKTDNFHFEVPDGWQEQPGNAFRAASFLIPGPDVPAADVSVSAFPGSVGGDLANVNRWRAQLNLPAIDAATMTASSTAITNGSLSFQVFDLVSAGAALEGGHRARILAAILKQGDQTWFFKITGEAEHVAAQRENFARFLRSFHFEAGA